MKTLRTVFASLAALALAAACTQEETGNPAFGEKKTPYIYMDWASSYVYKVGDTLRFTAQVSPLQGTSTRWLVGGTQVSDGLSIEYPVESDQGFTLRFEAERNGILNYRTAEVAIQKDFVPKEYTRKVMSVLTTGGNADMVQWDCTTHLMYTSLTVSEYGHLTLPDAAALASFKTIVSLAHNNGVYVIADVTGGITMPAGTGWYNAATFQGVLCDPALTAVLAADIRKFVDDYDIDGINLYLNELNNDAGALADHDLLRAGYNAVGKALPVSTDRGAFTFTASVPMAWNNYEFYFLGNVERLDWINILLFGGTDLSPVDYAPNWQIHSNLQNFNNAAGFPYGKIMVGVGAFGIRYSIPEGVSPTWGNLDSFLSYPLYSEIVKLDPDAPSKSYLDNNGNLYYTGAFGADVTSVESKAAIVKDYGAAGLFIWCVDYDTRDAASSLTRSAWNQLNP